MLERSDPTLFQPARDGAPPGSPEGTISVAALWAMMGRNRLLIGCIVAGMLALGGLYLALAQPLFTATTVLMIDTRAKLPTQVNVQASAAIESANVDSQVEVLRSESVIRGVVEALRLDADPTLIPPNPAVLVWLRDLAAAAGFPREPESADPVRRTIAFVEKNLTVKRLGMSYVIQIDYRADTPARAAEIANRLVDVYVTKQIEGRQRAEIAFNGWLERRAAVLAEEAQRAEQDFADRKLRKRLTDIEARVLGDQQLAELGSQLILAQAQRAEAQARLDRVTASGPGVTPDVAMADILRNEVMSRLRAQYIDVRRREAELAGRFGPANAAVSDLATEKAALERAMAEETQRIARAYAGDVEVARIREAALQASLDRAGARMATAAREATDLRAFESTAQTNRVLAETFARRLAELVPPASDLTADARVITRALQPRERSEPRTLLVLGTALALGLFGGTAAAALREHLRPGLRSGAQAEAALGLRHLGTLERVRAPNAVRRGGRAPAWMLRAVLELPASPMAEALRAVRVAARLVPERRPAQIIAVVSACAGEGRSVTAANLGHLCAAAGIRTLLVDADLRTAALSRGLLPAGAAEPGPDGLWTDPASGLALLPARPVPPGQAFERLADPAFHARLEARTDQFDLILIDLPPILTCIDPLALSGLVDAYLLVVAWGATDAQAVLEAVRQLPGLRERALGVLLNRADPAPSAGQGGRGS